MLALQGRVAIDVPAGEEVEEMHAHGQGEGRADQDAQEPSGTAVAAAAGGSRRDALSQKGGRQQDVEPEVDRREEFEDLDHCVISWGLLRRLRRRLSRMGRTKKIQQVPKVSTV